MSTSPDPTSDPEPLDARTDDVELAPLPPDAVPPDPIPPDATPPEVIPPGEIPATPPRPERESSSWATAPAWMLPTVVACLVAITFMNGVFGTFVLDDPSSITDNAEIKDLGDVVRIAKINVRRFVVYYSFALNWAIAGYNPGPYHIINILIHVCAAVVLYDLVRMSLRTSRLAPRFGREAPTLAAAIALLWGMHPLQTQSVTYIVQRTESLMGLFFLLTLWSTARGALGPQDKSLRFYLLAAICCWLGAHTKEVMIVCPFTLLLFDFTILSNDWREPIMRRGGLYFACFAAAGMMVLHSITTFRNHKDNAAMGFGSSLITSREFAQTQPEVILHYIKTAFWPDALCIDYRWPVETDVNVIVVTGAIIGLMLLLSVLALAFDPPLGFICLFFFFTLAPSSSFIPIIDLAFEHRMYLALASLAVLTVLVTWSVWNALVDLAPRWERVRFSAPATLLAVALLALGVRTFVRNLDYYSAEAFWRSVVEQRPNNPRAYHNLAVELANSSKNEEALTYYAHAIEIGEKATGHPLYKYHYNCGISFKNLGRWSEAEREFGAAARLWPGYADAHSYHGVALAQLHRTSEAIAELQRALKENSNMAQARTTLTPLLVAQGEYTIAVAEAERWLTTDASSSTAQFALARASLGLADYAKAKMNYEAALKTAVFDRLGKAELAWLYAACPDDAVRSPDRAIALAEEILDTAGQTIAAGAPEVIARDALAAALADQGKFDEAMRASDEAAAAAEALGDSAGALRIKSRGVRYAGQGTFRSTPSTADYLGR